MSKEFHQSVWNDQLADDCAQIVRMAVREDLDRWHDWTTEALVSSEAEGRAAFVARQRGVVAGLPAVKTALEIIDKRIAWSPSLSDGDRLEPGATLASITGPARSLLMAERIVLNMLSRLSGIATLTRTFVDAVAGAKARIYDTRKTTPGWRRLEKYAVRQGGGSNHRGGLFEAILIKDNHLALIRSQMPDFNVAYAVIAARRFVNEMPAGSPSSDMIIEIEVDSLDQLRQALGPHPDIVLLDNMNLDELRAAVRLRNELAPGVQLEVSGGIQLENARQIAETGVERISVGALTHSARWLDIGLDWLD